MASNTTDIQYLKGVGEKRAGLLKKRGIATVGALLRLYPRAYEDWSKIIPLFDCPGGETVCVKAHIITPVIEKFYRINMTLYQFRIADESGAATVTLFNNKYLAEKLHEGSEYLFYGKISDNGFERSFSSPEIAETGSSEIRPVYPASGQLSSRTLERLTANALKGGLGEDPLPQTVLERNSLCGLRFALENIHFPRSSEALERAKRRLTFEELFVLQASLMLMKGKRRRLSGAVIKRGYADEFAASLPFSLTAAQRRVIDECICDMLSEHPMNRLIQGDVGSGKTAAAAALCYTAAKNGFQSALMAPTEILAEQHFKTLSEMTGKGGLRCALLTGSLKKKEKNAVKQALRMGETDIVIGTHALLSDDVEFRSLGLVITDEQHRFGVGQRARLSAKGINPHTLVMSATPIPRTLALIVYGDLDVSVIDEYPAGRQKIETYRVDSGYHSRVYAYIKKHLDAGRQGYIVCPLVEENENSDCIPAEEYYKELSEGCFKGYRLGLLHGKMSAADKDKAMRSFKNGETVLLIATTVIEVGIDVPNAAIMVIENADRFGLSQLHQLRGRIGRGGFKSSCILISDNKSTSTRERLDVLCKNNDGFKIADEDLRLRGPGDFLGSRQHGLPELKIADIYADSELLRLAGREASLLLADDPALKKPENAALKDEITELYRRMNEN